MERLERVLSILSEIIEENKVGKYPLIKELAFQFSVSRRTVERDLALLERNGFHFSRGKKGLVFKKATVEEFLSDLTSSDYYSIALALKLFASYSSESFGKRATYILKILMDKLGTNESHDLKGALDSIDLSYQRREFVDDDILRMLLSACREKKTLKIRYHHPVRGVQYITISPQKLVFRKGHWYILTYSHPHDAPLLFRISRIERVEKSKMAYYQVPKETVRKLISTCWETHVSERTYKIKVWFDATAAPYVEDTLRHVSAKVTHYQDGSIDYELEVSGWKEITWWVLSWGSKAKLLEPDWMVRKIKKELKETLSWYMI